MIGSNTNYRFRIDAGVSRLPQFKSGKANMTESLK